MPIAARAQRYVRLPRRMAESAGREPVHPEKPHVLHHKALPLDTQ